jgi:outer membrane receptor for ferrienterochelin and colicin
VEVDLELKPLERLRFGGNYTFLKSKNEDTGTRLADRPNNTWNVFVEGRPMNSLTLRLDVNGVGNRLIPNFITTDAGDLPVIFIDPDGRIQGGSFANALTENGRTLSGYVKVDLAATYNIVNNRWHLKNWKVFGKVENLLDDQYQEKFGFPAPGITFLLGSQAIF